MKSCVMKSSEEVAFFLSDQFGGLILGAVQEAQPSSQASRSLNNSASYPVTFLLGQPVTFYYLRLRTLTDTH